ncbi:hypothetical protein QQ045_023642 [Rhodiola kirilowii]
MANKIVGVFLMCIFLAAAISVQARVKPYVDYLPVKPAAAHEEPVLFRYAKCFGNCKNECPKLQNESDCEKKCESECSKEFNNVAVKPTKFKPYIDFVPVKPTAAHEEPVLFRYAKCFESCKNECPKLQDESDCEKKCESECSEEFNNVAVKPTKFKPYIDFVPVKPTTAHEEPVLFRYAKCFENCKNECPKLQDESDCEKKCESECSKEFNNVAVKPTKFKPYIDFVPVKPTAAHEEPVLFQFAKCFKNCKNKCPKGESNCEQKCESECSRVFNN